MLGPHPLDIAHHLQLAPAKGCIMTKNYDVIDSDGHVLEPLDLWQRYIDPKFRDRAPHHERDADGSDWFVVEGRDGEPARYNIGLTGGLGRDEEVRNDAGPFHYEDSKPGGFDPHARVADLDAEGIDAAVLYPSLGLKAGAIRDPELAAAVARAYNRWLADFCSAQPDRLFGVAMLPMQSIEASVEEARFAREQLGFKAAFVRPNPYMGRVLSDRDYDVLWATAQDLDLAIGVHEGTSGGGAPAAGSDRLPPGHAAGHIVSHAVEMMLASLNIIWGGVCERFPDLRFGFLECGGGWMAGWLDRMDRHFDQPLLFNSKGKLAGEPDPLPLKPSEYFQRQCWISFEPVERSLPYLVDYLGPTKLLWGSDYPHPDGFVGAAKLIADQLPESKRRAVLAQGAIDFYKL